MRYVCLLRGINVSGHRKVTMKELLAMCTELGFQNATSYLQSGNLILHSKLKAAQVESLIEREISSRFGYPDVAVMAWTGADIAAAIKGMPVGWKDYDQSKLHFSFLKEAGKSAGAAALSDYLPDEFSVGKHVVYVYCPNGYGRTKLNNSFFERLLVTKATTRNWNTTSNLLELVNS
jgi:uncharacterized protein (DUF1697 family)